MLNPRSMSGGNRQGRGRGILGQYYPPGTNIGAQASGYGGGYYNDGGYGGGGYGSPGLDRQQESQLLQLLKRQSDVIEKLSEQVGLDNLSLPGYPGPGKYGGNYGSYGGYDDYGYHHDYPYMDMGYPGMNYGMQGFGRGRGRGGQRGGNQNRQPGAQQRQVKKGKSGYPVKTPVNIEPGQYEDNYTFYCHACKYQCTNNADRKNHNKGHKHLQRMEEVNRLPKHQAQPILDKIAEVKALREKEKKLMQCIICDIDLPVPYSDHKNQNQHKNRMRQVKAGCGCCKTGAFKNFTEFKEHRQLEGHKQNAESAREKLEAEIEKCTDEATFPAFEEGTPLGQMYIQRVEGFYCTLCKKFFLSEQEAKIEHCGIRAHYNKVKMSKIKSEETEEKTSDSEAAKSDSASANNINQEATNGN
ncbi:zinc finger protein on ecdysone puffs-like isoform X1 [Haliotis cracherodii]|uniref:zinc finger protein on ecdysone puffs-like isoform X1 n=1 Tax=Haliotis cracherodii TaxID=6455 RepID=UPI0039E79D9D